MSSIKAMNDQSNDSYSPEAQSTSTALVVVPENEIEDSESRNAPGFLQRLVYLFRPQSGSVRKNLQDALAAQNASDETITPEERAMLSNILLLQNMRVVDVMVPRAEIEAIDLKTRLDDLMMMFHTSGHSRMPVFGENLDDPKGMVHIRDVVSHLVQSSNRKRRTRKTTNNGRTNGSAKKPTTSVAVNLSRVDLEKTVEDLKIIREVLFVPPSMLASDLMERMQRQRIQMALVIDEYGGTDGLVSLEDVVEVVVGDIEDEHDDIEVRIEEKDDGIYLLDARVELEEVSEIVGKQFLKEAKKVDDDVETIGGLISALLGRVPVRGEVISSFAGHELEVMDADPRRIRRVKVSKSRQARRIAKREAGAASPVD